jgi:hypothetical protein
MWDAGREYSLSSAYKSQVFPYTGDKARCVLCQQELDEKASKRLKAFEAFCLDKSQKMAAQAVKNLEKAADQLALLEGLSGELKKLDADLVGMTPEQRDVVAEFAVKADERLKTVQESLVKVVWKNPASTLRRKSLGFTRFSGHFHLASKPSLKLSRADVTQR